jgi:hypothetical protein
MREYMKSCFLMREMGTKKFNDFSGDEKKGLV